MANLDELLGISEEERRAYDEAPRGCCNRKNRDPVEERLCSGGNCVELYCPCGMPRGMSWGPVDCPCQGDDT